MIRSVTSLLVLTSVLASTAAMATPPRPPGAPPAPPGGGYRPPVPGYPPPRPPVVPPRPLPPPPPPVYRPPVPVPPPPPVNPGYPGGSEAYEYVGRTFSGRTQLPLGQLLGNFPYRGREIDAVILRAEAQWGIATASLISLNGRTFQVQISGGGLRDYVLRPVDGWGANRPVVDNTNLLLDGSVYIDSIRVQFENGFQPPNPGYPGGSVVDLVLNRHLNHGEQLFLSQTGLGYDAVVSSIRLTASSNGGGGSVMVLVDGQAIGSQAGLGMWDSTVELPVAAYLNGYPVTASRISLLFSGSVDVSRMQVILGAVGGFYPTFIP